MHSLSDKGHYLDGTVQSMGTKRFVSISDDETGILANLSWSPYSRGRCLLASCCCGYGLALASS